MNCKDVFRPPTLDGEREMKQKFIALALLSGLRTTNLYYSFTYLSVLYLRGLQVALLLKS